MAAMPAFSPSEACESEVTTDDRNAPPPQLFGSVLEEGAYPLPSVKKNGFLSRFCFFFQFFSQKFLFNEFILLLKVVWV